MQPDKIKVFGYKRVSTEEQVDGMSLHTQELAIRNYADANGFELVEIYSDEGLSAKTAKRPQLQKMISDIIQAKGIGVLIVYNLSRLSRNLQSFSRDIGYYLSKQEVTLYSTQENIDDTPQGMMMKNLALTLHQYDNDFKAKVTRDNMGLVAQEGWWQSKIPYGYSAVKVPIGLKTRDGKVKTRLTLEPDNSHEIAVKISLFLNRFSQGDITQTELINYAASIGLKSATGDRLAPQSIKNMLTHIVYAGYIKNKHTGNELIKAKHEGLISFETYQRNQDILRGVRQISTSPRFTNEYPLKHTLLCDSCHKPLTGSAPRTGSGARSPRYHCTRCKGAGSISVAKMEGAFQELLEDITPTDGTIKLFKTIVKRTAVKKLTNVNKQISSLRESLNKIDNDINKATQRYFDDDISKEEKDMFQQAKRIDRIELEGRIDDLEGVQRLNEGTIDYVCNFIDKPVKMWRDADMESKIMLQKMIMPNGIEFNIKARYFGTTTISPLYRLESIKKEPLQGKDSLLVS